MIRIIADSHIPLIKGILEPYAFIEYMPGEVIKQQNLKNTDALIIRTRTKCDSSLLKNTAIKFIASATIGTDHIDLDYCSRNNISVKNAPGCNSASVCQYIMSALISIAKKHKFSLQNKTIGIIGHGNVGIKVAKFAKVLGMNVLLNDPPKQNNNSHINYVSLDKIKRKADIISLHVPLTRSGQYKTQQLIDAKFISDISPDTILINSSRGEVVDETYLKVALKTGKINTTVLDVWNNEPDIDKELLELTEFGTPHIAGYSVDGKANGSAMVINKISSFFNFNLNNWHPDNLPCVKNRILNPLSFGKSDEEILYNIVLNTYDIQANNDILKLDPGKFENLRYKHPIRREYPFYKLSINGLSENLVKQLGDLGFNLSC